MLLTKLVQTCMLRASELKGPFHEVSRPEHIYRKFSIKSPWGLINFKHSRGNLLERRLIGERGFINFLKIVNS